MDRIEDFIRNNREAFDDKTPSASGWRNVRNSIFSGNKPGIWNNVVLWRAAAILFLVISVALTFSNRYMTPVTSTASLREFGDVESFYVKQISQKTALLEQIAGGEEADELTQDFQRLEAMYLVLREELKKNPTKEVKDALVLNLLVRINLLNQQIDRLEDDYTPSETDAGGKSI